MSQRTQGTGYARTGHVDSKLKDIILFMWRSELHKFSVYVQFLLKMIPKSKFGKIDVDDKVLLDKYKLKKDFEGSMLITEVRKLARRRDI